MRIKSKLGAALALCLIIPVFISAADAPPDNAADGLARCLGRLGLVPSDISSSLRSAESLATGADLLAAPGLDLGHNLELLLAAERSLDSCSGVGDFLAAAFRGGRIGPCGFACPDPPSEYLVAADSLERILTGGRRVLLLLWRADCRVRAACDSLSRADVTDLDGLLMDFPLQEDQWPHFPVERMLALARRVDLDRMAAGLCTLDSAAALCRTAPEPPATLELPWCLDTPLGEVVLLGPGSDRYSGAPLLLLDFGGDDSLELRPAEPLAVNLALDRGGNDFWHSTGSFGGGALLGVSWIEDAAGDDHWVGGDNCFGFAACGASMLLDRAGDDTYNAGHGSQGAALFGVCLALDLAGDDKRGLGFFGQGAVAGSGVALLADLAGDDSCRAGGLYPDWREPGVTKSFAQGAALGIRPFQRGGLALLYDRSGVDFYGSDYFGQGAGYWGGVGLLIDCSGDDRYRAVRYGQGVGLHFAAGFLLDLSGDDSYSIRAVGQGAGEDRALGALVELSGTDSYTSGWMVRGAGGTGGVGLFLELSGADRYAPAGKLADGAGNRWLELPGLGFSFDCAGNPATEDYTFKNGIRRSGVWGAEVHLGGGADAGR